VGLEALIKKVWQALLACLVALALISTHSLAQNSEVEIETSRGPVDGRTQDLPELTEHSPLSDYLSYAALNNPGLEAAFNRWRAALKKVPQVTALPEPRFTYAYYIQEVETRVGPQRHKLGLSQTLPWFGKLGAKGEVALWAAEAEKARYEAIKQELFFEVADAYYDYYFLCMRLLVTEDHFELMTALEAVARKSYAAGVATNSDLIKAQVELARQEDMIHTLRDLAHPTAARLNAALGRPANAPLPWPARIEYTDVCLSADDLRAWLREGAPQLAELTAVARMEEKKKELAGLDYYPDLTLGLDYIETDKARMPNVSDSGKDPVIVSASVNLPIWGKKYRAAEEEAELLRLAALSKRVDVENRLGARLELAIFEVRDADRKIELYRDALVPKARQALEVSERSFSAGKSGFIDVIDAQRTLLDFELEAERAFVERERAFAGIEKLIARRIKESDCGAEAQLIEQENVK